MKITPHQLEVFYFVVLRGGIKESGQNMTYGLERSSISRVLCELERAAGVKLYERRPFKVTEVGRKLFEFIRPMFENLEDRIQAWAAGMPDELCLGASSVAQRKHLAPIMSAFRRKFPAIRLRCVEGSHAEIKAGLRDGSLDIAVTPIEDDVPPGYECKIVARLPLVLLVPKSSKLRCAPELWRQPQIREELISLRSDNPISRCFAQGIRRRKIVWPISLEVPSIELMEAYVANKSGVGVSMTIPGRSSPAPGVRELPLPDFPHVSVGVVWKRDYGQVMEELMKKLCQASQQFV